MYSRYGDLKPHQQHAAALCDADTTEHDTHSSRSRRRREPFFNLFFTPFFPLPPRCPPSPLSHFISIQPCECPCPCSAKAAWNRRKLFPGSLKHVPTPCVSAALESLYICIYINIITDQKKTGASYDGVAVRAA